MVGHASVTSLTEQAVAWAQEAGRATLGWFRSADLDVLTKADGTPVTAADKAAERLLRERIEAAHPDDAIVGEEEDDRAGTSGRRWIIDPIDGTKAFAHGVPLYSQLLLVEDDDGPLAAVINLPALAETVFAGRDLGCFCNDVRSSVNDHRGLDGAYLMTSGLGSWPLPMIGAVQDSPLGFRTWGDGYGYALVATGRAEAMVDPEANPWDLAPMPLIMAEAGGRFSDLRGAPGYDHGSGIATNGHVHDDVLALVAPHLPDA